jgi:hypothetical protein
MSSLATKITITKSRAGHYWLRVRSLACPDIYVGDAFSTMQQARAAVPRYVEQCRAAVRLKVLWLNANASEAPTFTD